MTDAMRRPFIEAFEGHNPRREPYTITSDGRRSSSYTSYYQPIAKRPNLKLLYNTEVQKILFDGRTAVGIDVTYGHPSTFRRRQKIFARKEIILSAGAVSTPQLLMLSVSLVPLLSRTSCSRADSRGLARLQLSLGMA